jgi:Pyridine nucleotide-disulphide oxidoreductase
VRLVPGNPAWQGKILIRRFDRNGKPTGWSPSSTRQSRDAAYHYLTEVRGPDIPGEVVGRERRPERPRGGCRVGLHLVSGVLVRTRIALRAHGHRARLSDSYARPREAGYGRSMGTRVLILGAGFGGLELSTMLSEAFGGDLEVTLIDRRDAFVFGFSKLDVMFGRTTPAAVRLPYRDFAKPGVRFLQETITAIDPETRRVTTDAGVHEADVLVVALGAGYDFDATPGLADGANEFYTPHGAERLAEIVPSFSEGRVVVGVCGAPFKCPPAPSECALLLDDALTARGVRDHCEISFVIPLGRPVPPSPDTSAALETEFAKRGITFIPGRRIGSVDPARSVAALDDGAELPFELFLAGSFNAPSAALVAEKEHFGSSRRARWFGT